MAEKVKFLRALVSEVRIDERGNITVGFHSQGIKELCQPLEASQ